MKTTAIENLNGKRSDSAKGSSTRQSLGFGLQHIQTELGAQSFDLEGAIPTRHKRRLQLKASLPISIKCLLAFSKLDEEVLISVLHDAVIQKFKQKESVLQPGESDDRIHLVVDGVVTLYTYTQNGRHIINDYLGRGYFFGETA